jgi:sperm-associated antigen 16 protein
MSSEDKEEVFVLEKADISVDDDDEGYNYDEIKDSEDEEDSLKQLELDEEDDLSDFELLKAKANHKKIEKQSMHYSVGTMGGTYLEKTKHKHEGRPKLEKKQIVIEDYIRNYMSKFGMNKTLNTFQYEWSQLQKKDTFNDNHIGQFTDTENKNKLMEARIQSLKVELEKEQIKAEKAKSTWLKLRKERDFHKTHTQRVEKEKNQISENIKKLVELQEQYEDKIKELNKKYEMTLKDKTLLQLEKEKLQKRIQHAKAKMKQKEEEIAQAIEQSRARHTTHQKKQILHIKGKNTPYPEDDARPNPFLAQEYDDFNAKASNQKIIKAHEKRIRGMCLHFKKQILATVSDDCVWKIWNMEDGENILSGEGHKDWLSGVDFHPAGSHLATSGGDKTVKIWDFINS